MGKGKARQPKPRQATTNKKVADLINRFRDALQPPTGPSSADSKLGALVAATRAHETTATLGANELDLDSVTEEEVPTTNPMRSETHQAMEMLRPHSQVARQTMLHSTVETQTTDTSESKPTSDLATATQKLTHDPFIDADTPTPSEAPATTSPAAPDRSPPDEDRTTPTAPKIRQPEIYPPAAPSFPLTTPSATTSFVDTGASTRIVKTRLHERPLTWEELWAAWRIPSPREIEGIRSGNIPLEVIGWS